jgi:hypothetical protein
VGLNPNGAAAAAAGLAALVTHISAHNAVPDVNGSNETPGVTRAAVAWTNTNGLLTNAAQLVHAVPAAGVVGFYGLWGALAGGTFYGYETRCGAGESRTGFGSVDAAGVIANAVQSAAHGLVNDMTVLVYNVLGEALPTGLTEGQIYFVVGATTNTFQLSLTQAGAAVDITGQGELYFARFVAHTFTLPGNLVTGAGALAVNLATI